MNVLPKKIEKALKIMIKDWEPYRQKRIVKEFSLIYFDLKENGLLRKISQEHQFYLICRILTLALKSKITTMKKFSLNSLLNIKKDFYKNIK